MQRQSARHFDRQACSHSRCTSCSLRRFFRVGVNQNRLSLRSGSGNRNFTNLSFAMKQITAELWSLRNGSGFARFRHGIFQQPLSCLVRKPSPLASLLVFSCLKSGKDPGNPGKVKPARGALLFLPGTDCRSADAPLLRGFHSREAVRLPSCLNAFIDRFSPHFRRLHLQTWHPTVLILVSKLFLTIRP